MISPVTKVALTPMRVEMKPAKNIVKAVTSRYEVKSSIDSNAVAPSCSAIVGRIGDTSPIPINDAAVAKVMAHTLAGCFKICPAGELDIKESSSFQRYSNPVSLLVSDSKISTARARVVRDRKNVV